MAARTQVVVTTVGPYPRYGLPLGGGVRRGGHRLRRSDRRDAVHPREHRPVSQAGRRHRCAHRAFVRIRFHPFGSHRLRAVPAGRAGRCGSSSATPTWWCARSSGGVSGGTDRVDDGGACARLRGSRGAGGLMNDPYTLTPDRAAEPELGAPARHSLAPWPRHRARTRRVLGRAVRDGGARTPELSGAAMLYWTTPTAGGSSTPSR